MYRSSCSSTVPAAPVPCQLPWHRASCPGTVPAAPVPCQLPRYRASCPGIMPAAPVPCQLLQYRASCPGTVPTAQAPCYHLPALLAAQRSVQFDLQKEQYAIFKNFVRATSTLFLLLSNFHPLPVRGGGGNFTKINSAYQVHFYNEL